MAINIPYLKIIETLAIIIAIIAIRYFSSRVMNAIQDRFSFDERRKILVSKTIYIISNVFGLLLIIGIWGVNQEDLALYFASILTVIGVAFFAQWSHISNITAGIILYFNHPIRIGDTIKIMEKDDPISGKIMDIGLFFMTIKNVENRQVLISNSNFLQKIVSINPTLGPSFQKQDLPANEST